MQAMKMQMKDYEDNTQEFVGQMLHYINANKANHDNVTGLMATVLPARIWRKSKELARWPDVPLQRETVRQYDAWIQLLIHLRTAISPPEVNWGKVNGSLEKELSV